MPHYIFPFKGLHPNPKYVSEVIAPPYDVVSRAQAKAIVKNKPYNFLHITRAEIDLPDVVDDHDDAVYQKAAQNFQKLLQKNILEEDNRNCFYIYQMQQGAHIQTGVLAKVSCSAYQRGQVRRHELTRPDKVLDRTKHIEALYAQVSPTLLANKTDPILQRLLQSLIQDESLLEAELQGVIHRIWRITDPKACDQISTLLNQHETLYIADGHHRNEAAYQMCCKHPESSDCLAAIFPEDELKILGYHRVVKSLNSETPESFIEKLKQNFNVKRIDTLENPKQKGIIHLYLSNQTYALSRLEQDSEQLDVDVLTERVLKPILSITDIRQDKNIAFIGGLDALEKIKTEVDAGAYVAGFVLYPTSMQELLQVADANEIMPPKSTWFEPKLADGLLSYLINA